MKDFLKSSEIAGEVKLDTNVVLYRKKMSSADLLSLEAEGGVTMENREPADYELEVNGLAVACGSVIKKRGEYYFKVKEMYGEA